MKKYAFAAAGLAALAATAACAPRMNRIRAVQPNGAIVLSTQDDDVARARSEAANERTRLAAEQDQVVGRALSDCTPLLCNAVARGELAVGMTREQVIAATHSGPAAWEERGGGGITTLTPREGTRAPHDGVSEVAFVTLEKARAELRLRERRRCAWVERADAKRQGAARARRGVRARATTGLAGDSTRAEPYDRATWCRTTNRDHAEHRPRADKQLRPFEASIRYQLLLHQLETRRSARTAKLARDGERWRGAQTHLVTSATADDLRRLVSAVLPGPSPARDGACAGRGIPACRRRGAPRNSRCSRSRWGARRLLRRS